MKQAFIVILVAINTILPLSLRLLVAEDTDNNSDDDSKGTATADQTDCEATKFIVIIFGHLQLNISSSIDVLTEVDYIFIKLPSRDEVCQEDIAKDDLVPWLHHQVALLVTNHKIPSISDARQLNTDIVSVGALHIELENWHVTRCIFTGRG